MTWHVRHAGSPRSVQGLTLAQIIVGLREGLWETTDEVMGPQDQAWQTIEAHPQLQAVAAEFEPPPPPAHPDETRLDLNALIDVCLVLLILFILTATYAEKKKVIPVPITTDPQTGNVRIVTAKEVEKFMIKVKVRGKDNNRDEPLIWVEDKPVAKDQFRDALGEWVKKTDKHEMMYDVAGVNVGTAIDIQDLAKEAQINSVKWLIRKREGKAP
jgi:biopolymer transport protein ExbD